MKRNGELNFLRFSFSIIILVFHWSLTFKYGVITNGNIGVEFFFILNGLFMCKKAEQESQIGKPIAIADTTWHFLVGKIQKFYPYYVCVILLQLLIRFVIIKGMSMTWVSKELFYSIPTFSLSFMVLNYKTASLYVGNTWYLSSMLVVMLMIYPLLLKSFDNHSKITIPLVCMFLLGYLYQTNGSIMVWESWSGCCYYATLRALADISFGICIYVVSGVLKKRFGRYHNSIIVRMFFTVFKILCYYLVFALLLERERQQIIYMFFCGWVWGLLYHIQSWVIQFLIQGSAGIWQISTSNFCVPWFYEVYST